MRRTVGAVVTAAFAMGSIVATASPSAASAGKCVGGGGGGTSYQTCATVEGEKLSVSDWRTQGYSSLGGQDVYAYFYANGERIATVKKHTGTPGRLSAKYPKSLPKKFKDGTELCNKWSFAPNHKPCVTVHK